MPKPVIAAVNGYAMAGGFELLTVVDFALAAEDAVIGDRHIKHALLAAGGAPYRLPLLIGIRKAKDLMLRGKTITGKEAEELGLVNQAVPAYQHPNQMTAVDNESSRLENLIERLNEGIRVITDQQKVLIYAQEKTADMIERQVLAFEKILDHLKI